MFQLTDIRKTKVWQEAHDEGHVEGLEKGLERGREEGREEGAVEQNRVIALRMQANGKPVEEIARDLGITKSQVRKLLKPS